MLEEQMNGFIAYCKVSGFRDKSIELQQRAHSPQLAVGLASESKK